MTPAEPTPEQNAKLARYPATVLEFVDGPTIDLRRPIGEPERRALVANDLAGSFAILTAENPRGENAEDAPSPRQEARQEVANAIRTSVLETELARRAIPFSVVDCVSPDGSYRERSCAVVLPRAEAVRLARDLEQLAIFWYDGRDFWLVPAAVDAPERRLPVAQDPHLEVAPDYRPH